MARKEHHADWQSDGQLVFSRRSINRPRPRTGPPALSSHCGTCTACLDACPTDAFVRPGVLEATRCISYLTIELREPIPRELRPGIGDWLFGCDVCQDVCPWNRKAPPASTDDFEPVQIGDTIESSVDVCPMFAWNEDQFRNRFRKTPLWRSKRRGILRNAAIVLGNDPSQAGLKALAIGIEDGEALVRGASAWALGQHLDFPESRECLTLRRSCESDSIVQEEIEMALRQLP